MHTHEKKHNQLFEYFLLSSLVIILIMIIVGGLTRLTDSGLSITEWELFKGIFPPMNNADWVKYFNLYKNIPQYKLLNNTMTLTEFKIIFYWEYAHRALGRLIGIFFFSSIIFFYIQKKINKKYLNICFLVFLLICIQGFIGWYMVESGLINNVTVSHYRLSLHLSIAFIIISIIFWVYINFKKKILRPFFIFNKENTPFLFLILLLFFQVILGAFVSGLDAGKLYQTWPLMDHSYFPSDINILNFKNLLDFDNHSLVQFYHRNLAYLITLYVLILSFFIFKNKLKILFVPLYILIGSLIIQIFLGIFTLISGLNIYLASAHQISSVILVFSALNLYYYHVK